MNAGGCANNYGVAGYNRSSKEVSTVDMEAIVVEMIYFVDLARSV